MTVRPLDSADKQLFFDFNKRILDNLQNKDWFIPFAPDDDGVLQPRHDFFYGQFDGDALVGISGLIFEEKFLGELREILGLQGEKIAEVGGSMVLPQYRGRNIMLTLNKMLVDKAREMGLTYLVATVHPDNIASSTSAEKLGFVKQTVINRKGRYLRNLYLMKL